MHRFVIGGAKARGVEGQLIDGVFRLRHRVFKSRLNWDVQSVDGREIDDFDDDDATYVIAQNAVSQEVDAAWRLRPTTLPYMLKETFPLLLNGWPAPQSSKIWEVSRFAVQQNVYESSVQSFSELTQDLIAHTVLFAVERGIESYVWVTSVGVERMAVRLGYRLRRYGAPTLIGDVRCVANEVIMDSTAVSIARARLDLDMRAVA